MAVSIRVNGLSLVHRGSGGTSSATLPDVCDTPVAGRVPFTNTAYSRDLEGGSCSIDCDGGNAVALEGSRLTPSTGDEPGSRGGVVSGTCRGAATFLSHSFDVLFEGRGVCRLTDKMLHNDGNTVDCAGILQAQVAGYDGTRDELLRKTTDRAVLVVEVVAEDASGALAPVKRADVHVDGHATEHHRLTNREGMARFVLPAGAYSIHVHRKGFKEAHEHGHAAKPEGRSKVRLHDVGEVQVTTIPAYGIHNPLHATPEESEPDFEIAAKHNMRYMRINAVNDQNDTPEQQAARIAGYVDTAKRLAAHGIVSFPTLAHVDGSRRLIGPAAEDTAGRAHWAAFVTGMCNQLKPGGAAWGGGSDKLAVRCWEIWNEPNLDMFWPAPDPQRFLVTLREARAALNAADSNSRAIFGGLSQIKKNYDPIRFLRAVIEHGGKKLFDAVAIHPYGNKPAKCMSIVGSVYRELKHHKMTARDPATDVQIWITEVGWSVPNAPWAPGGGLTAKDPDDQAFRFGRLARLIEQKREAWRLGPTFWYCFYDYDGTTEAANTWAANCGIFDSHARTLDADGNFVSFVPAGVRPASVTVAKRAMKKGKLREVALPPLRK